MIRPAVGLNTWPCDRLTVIHPYACRYGGESSSFEELLQMSLAEPDSAEINPWWSLYCAEGVTACD
jgi:hypothetical protein